MSLPIRLDRAAEVEMQEAFDWYEFREPGLGTRFTTAVDATLNRIGTNPLRYPAEYRDVREALVSVFPYAVYFLIRRDHIRVLSVFHTSRDPAVWRGRR